MHRFRHATGLDRAVSLTVLMRVVSAVMGLATLLLIAARLSKIQQGFYFTFGTILQFQLDFGLYYVVMQVASHEMAWLSLSPEGRLVGDEAAKARLAAFLRSSCLWYFGIAVVVVLAILPGGIWYLANGPDASHADWRLPWILFCLATAGYIGLFALLSFLEGLGLVSEVAIARLIQTVVGSLGLWFALFTPNGLYAAFANYGLSLLSGLVWVVWCYRGLLLDLLRTAGGHFSWREHVWPFQWRVGASWIAGFFTTSFFVPVLYRTSGAAEAGRMGMILQILLAISGLAVAWISTKAPTFGKLVAARDFASLDASFALATKRVVAVAAICGFGFWLGVVAANALGLPIAARMLPPFTCAVLLFASVFGTLLSCLVIYLRAYRQEPLLLLSVVMGACIVAGAFLTARRYGSLGLSLDYLAALLVVGIGWGSVVFRAKRAEWQRELAAAPNADVKEVLECEPA